MVKREVHPFKVKRVDGNATERLATVEFIEKVALLDYNSTPPPSSQTLFAAYQGNDVVGSISLDFESTVPLPLERIWQFDSRYTPFPFKRELIAQYGRWMAKKPGVSSALLFVATLFARTCGKHICLCEVKGPTAGRLKKLGVVLHLIDDAQLLLDQIPASGRSYYTSEPPPVLYMIDLAQMEQASLDHIPAVAGLECLFGSFE